MSAFAMTSTRVNQVKDRASYFHADENNRSGKEDYYFEYGDTLASGKFGKSLAELGLTGSSVSSGDYESVFNGVNPETGEVFVSEERKKALENDPDAIAGFSSSFNLDKSFSLYFATATNEQKKAIGECVMDAAKEAMEYFQDHYAQTRLGKGGQQIKHGTLSWFQYLHCTNRNKEPHLHVHVEIPNQVHILRNGKSEFHTLDGGALFKRQAEMRSLFDVVLASRIKERRELSEIHHALKNDFMGQGLSLAGVSDELKMRFSSRRQEIKDIMNEGNLNGAEAASSVAQRSRNNKDEKIDVPALVERWKADIQEAGGLTLENGGTENFTEYTLENALFKGKSIFTDYDIDRVAAAACINHSDMDKLPVFRERLMEKMNVFTMRDPLSGQTVYTTRDMIGMESDILRFAYQSQNARPYFGQSRLDVNAALATIAAQKGFALTQEQAGAVYHATGDEQLVVVKGAAGTGKSQSFSAIREVYENAGFRVIGLAPSGVAAAELGESAGIQSTGTIHSLILKLESGNATLNSGDVLILDEAGMVDTRLMHSLLSHVHQSGAKIIMAGDEKQLDAISSASMLANIAHEVGHREIRQIMRQRNDPKALEIAQAWFDGGRALAMMKENGNIEETATRKDAVSRAVELYRDQVERFGYDQTLALADARADVRALNAVIRADRQAAGEIGAGVVRNTQFGQFEFSVGDRVLLRENDTMENGQAVFNGSRGEVVGLGDDNSLQIRLDSGLTIDLPPDYDALQHGYAMTVHKSQGVTVDSSVYLPSAWADRSSGYVAFTRSRYAATFVSDAETLAEVEKRMAEFDSKRSAIDFVPGLRNKIKENAEQAMQDAPAFMTKVVPLKIRMAAENGKDAKPLTLVEEGTSRREYIEPNSEEIRQESIRYVKRVVERAEERHQERQQAAQAKEKASQAPAPAPKAAPAPAPAPQPRPAPRLEDDGFEM